MTSVQPAIYIPVPLVLPPSGYNPNQPGDGQQQSQIYPSLQPSANSPYFQHPVIPAPPPRHTVPFVISVQKAYALLCLGFIQVVLGTLSIFFNGVSYYVYTTFTLFGPGFWAGVPVSI